jgi:hypothetical protein
MHQSIDIARLIDGFERCGHRPSPILVTCQRLPNTDGLLRRGHGPARRAALHLGITWKTARFLERLTGAPHCPGTVAASQKEDVMAQSARKTRANTLSPDERPPSRLPRHFPVGTKFVIEARNGGDGPIYSRHLEFPDGTWMALPPRRGASRRRSGIKPDRAKSR